MRGNRWILWMLVAAAVVPAARGAGTGGTAEVRPVGPSVVEGRVLLLEEDRFLRLDNGITVDLGAVQDLDAGTRSWGTPGVRVRVVGQAVRRNRGVLLIAGSSPVVLGGAPPVFHRTVEAAAKDGSEMTVQGRVTGFFPDGFLLEASTMSTYQVTVTGETEFEGVDGLDGLEIGDEVEVQGARQMWDMILASRVRLLSGDGGGSGGDEITVEGIVGTVESEGFILQTMMESYHVLVGPQTEWVDLSSLADLDPGDRVEVRGSVDGWTLSAIRVRLLTSGGGDGGGGGSGGGSGGGTSSCSSGIESVGEITAVAQGGRFWMDDGRMYATDDGTVYSPEIGSAAGLSVGLYVRVLASYRHHAGLVANEITYVGDHGQGQDYENFEGTVTAVSEQELELSGGRTVKLTGATRYEGDADSATDIQVGWSVQGTAVATAAGGLEAVTVWARDPAPPTLEGQSYVPHEALVIPVEGVDVAAVAERHGAVLAGTIGSVGALFWWDDELTDGILADVAEDPDVVAVEPNYRFRDPESSRKRYPIVDRSPTSGELNQQPALTVADVPAAGVAPTGEGIVVAVLDTGVDPLHPALRHGLLEGGLDLVDGDSQPWESRDGVDEDGDGDIDEAAGHGTFVASVIRLVAPGALILPYRVLDDDGGGTAYDLAVALADAIERRVDVINVSLTYRERSEAVDRLLERAAAAGIVVVASAGNDGSPDLPFPAEDGHVLAVGALDVPGSALADFSNGAGDAILAAPGTEVYGALDEGRFGTSTGTSMAAPFVSGAAALLLDLEPRLDPEVLALVLRETAVPLSQDPGSALRLDVAAALDAARP